MPGRTHNGRPMKTLCGRLARVVLAALVVTVAAPGAAEARGAGGPAGRVLLVAAPGVTVDDMLAGRAPVLRRLAEEWSLGAMSIRTVGSSTNLANGYTTIGAGGRALGLDEERGIVPSTREAPGGGLVVAMMGAVRSGNTRLRLGTQPGALGEALREANVPTAVVGNAAVICL